MEAARTSETSVDIYLATWKYIPQDYELHTHSCENLKSHNGLFVNLTTLPQTHRIIIALDGGLTVNT
jgi:hypothetical protein